MMKRRLGVGWMVMWVSMVIVVSCGPHESHQSDAVVVWTELNQLDELSETAIQYLNQEDVTALREMAGELMSAARQVSEMEPPAQSKNRDQVKLLQDDLQGVTLEDAQRLSLDEWSDRVHAIHSITVNLMESAGVPHVHDHDVHDQDDHDDHEGHYH